MNKTAYLEQLSQTHGIAKLLEVIALLRHPEQGCPWDLKQTHLSLRPYLLEEAYEAVEAIDASEISREYTLLKEELGDVLLQVVLHSQLAQDVGNFNFEDVCNTISEKLIRRHPHVFGEASVLDADAVVTQWEAIKRDEKSGSAQLDQNSNDTMPDSILKNVAKSQPALSRALETSKRAVKVGFEWPNLEALWECVMSEYEELREEVHQLAPNQPVPPEQFRRIEAEMGDIFFASVNLARHFKVDPEVALTQATAKFSRRFQEMEKLISEQLEPEQTLEQAMVKLDFDAWDALWLQAKKLTEHQNA